VKRFVLSPAATADIEQIEVFLDRHAPHATDKVLTTLYDAIVRIAATPGIGHARLDLANERLLFFPVWSYLVVYRATNPVEIVRVVHGARDVARALRRRRGRR
jgi:plasmid stabilization system protein ParE